MRQRQSMKFFKQARQVVDQVQRREIRGNEFHSSCTVGGFSGEETLISPAVERHGAGLDELSTMDREVLAHCRVNVVCPNRKAALGIASCIDAWPCAEVEHCGVWTCNSLNQILKRRTRETIRWQFHDCLVVVRACMKLAHGFVVVATRN